MLGLIPGSCVAEEEASFQPEKAVGDKPSAEQLYGLGQRAFEAGDIELALEHAEALIRQAPEDLNGYYLRGTILGQGREDYAAAAADLAEVNRLAPAFADAWGNRGWYLILLGHFEEARVATERAQALNPESMSATINLGHAYLLLGDRESAHAWYRKAIPLIPDEAALDAGPLADFDLFIEHGWVPEAARAERAWVAQAWRREWQEVGALNARVLERYRAGDYQGAIPVAEEGLRRAVVPHAD